MSRLSAERFHMQQRIKEAAKATRTTCDLCAYDGPEFFHVAGQHLCADCQITTAWRAYVKARTDKRLAEHPDDLP